MLISKIECLREELYAMLDSGESDYNKVLSLSQKLDVLIAAYAEQSLFERDRLYA
jgi:hypothetical protein